MTKCYTLTQPEKVQLRFQTANGFKGKPEPKYNIRQGHALLTVSSDHRLRDYVLIARHFGFIPPWASAVEGQWTAQAFARAETVHETKMFCDAFQTARCLAVVDGCYIWDKDENQPYYLRLKSKALFSIAAISSLNPRFSTSLQTVAVLTIYPNDLVAAIHPRMPMILRPEVETTYLDSTTPLDTLRELFVPYPENEMELYRVSPKLNKARSNSKKFIEPIDGVLEQRSWLDNF